LNTVYAGQVSNVHTLLCDACYTRLFAELDRITRRYVGCSRVEDGINNIFKGLEQGLGLDLDDVNFTDTPKRVARAYSEIFDGLVDTEKRTEQILSSAFPCELKDMVVIAGITAFSMCPHHLLPVEYAVDVGYIPNGHVLGLSKLIRLVNLLARRPVLQETLTVDIVNALEKIGVKGAMCVIAGIHYCIRMRGAKDTSSKTITSAMRGVFSDMGTRMEFFKLVDIAARPK
jgi:GTP cyclohydrolase I